jgi:hypothetical protein
MPMMRLTSRCGVAISLIPISRKPWSGAKPREPRLPISTPDDLRAFAAAVRPKMVVPVHGVKWDEESHGFGTVRRLADAETMVIE